MPKKIEGTVKFEVYFFRGKNKRKTADAQARHFVYYQWGRIQAYGQDGKRMGKSKPFNNYGQMLDFINKIMRNAVQEDLKEKRCW